MSLMPMTTQASTNSRLRIARNSPRTRRAIGGQETTRNGEMTRCDRRREHRHQQDGEDEERDSLEDLGDAHQQRVDPAAEVAGEARRSWPRRVPRWR